MTPEKIRELKEKRKTLQRELQEIEDTAIPERRINDQGQEVTFVSLGWEKLKRMGALRNKIEQISEQLQPHERRPRKSKPPRNSVTQVVTSGPPPAFFTEAMLAERWYCSNSRLQLWRRDGKGPSYVKIEGRILYPYDALVKFEIERLVKTETSGPSSQESNS